MSALTDNLTSLQREYAIHRAAGLPPGDAARASNLPDILLACEFEDDPAVQSVIERLVRAAMGDQG